MKRAGWLALVAVVAVTLVVGVTDRAPATADERARNIGDSIMCPACSGETVTNSQAPVAVNIRRQIQQRIADGETDGQIRDALVRAYGERIDLNPPKSGLAGLVWILPVAALVGAAAGLVVVFRRWRTPADVVVSDDDRAAAERARRVER